MNRNQGVLQNRPILVGLLLVFLYEAITLWPAITKYARFPKSSLTILGLVIAVFITTSIAYRSSFVADRIVFGAITIISVLTAIRMAPLSSREMLCVRTLEALMWTLAAIATLVVLLRGIRIAPEKLSSHKQPDC